MKVKKIYCDACRKDITDLHRESAKMILYFYVWHAVYETTVKRRRRMKIHLCDKCWRELGRIAERNEVTENE